MDNAKPPPPPAPQQPPQKPPPQPQPQPQQPPQQQQQQQYVFRQFQQQQQQAVMARFPSNIDAHLFPLSVNRPHLNPNPNLTIPPVPPPKPNPPPPPPPSHPPPPPPQQPPSQPPPPQPQLEVWRLQSNLKRPFDSPLTLPLPLPLPLSDKLADDTVFSVRDRKVRISEKNALYALCRSWLRNGFREESQPHYGDVSRSLPKPLQLPESSSPEKKEIDDETNGEDETAVATLSSEELLQRHIKRAKRVRERLREERSRRIERYKSRLNLLLPHPLELCRDDTGPP